MVRHAHDWLRVTKRRPCPICSKPDWCLIAVDGAAVICPRTPEGAVRQCGEAGYLHRLKPTDSRRPTRTWRVRVNAAQDGNPEISGLAAEYRAAVDKQKLANFARTLGVSPESLLRIGTGWDGQAWTFPMVDATGTTCGIRRRFPDGRKLSLRGGHEGVFVPADLPDENPIVVCEGPTDTAAIIDLGFVAIGRPSCTGGSGILIKITRGREVVIIADADGPGQQGAHALASTLRLYCPTVRIITPPDGIEDMRAWRQAGATRDDVVAVIQLAPEVCLTVETRVTA